jgi:hypothetical protein
MNSQYNLLLPLSAQPSGGFKSGMQVDFMLQGSEKAIKPGTVNLTGTLAVTKTIAGVTSALEDTDLITLNPNAGAHGLWKYLILEMADRTVEINSQYGLYHAAKTEAMNSTVELGANSSAVPELKVSNADGNYTTLGQAYLLGQSTGVDENKIYFSINLDCALNNASAPIPFSKSGAIHLRLTVAEVSEAFRAPSIAISAIDFSISDLALRYETVDAVSDAPVIMEKVMYGGQQSILSSFNTFSAVPPASFHSSILLFRNKNHNNTGANLTYDTLLNESFQNDDNSQVIPNYVEWSLLGADTGAIQFPLMTQEEHLFNYLMAQTSGKSVKNGVNYSKLLNKKQACGYGLGAYWGQELPGGLPVQTTINFTAKPDSDYNVYIFFKGSLAL